MKLLCIGGLLLFACEGSAPSRPEIDAGEQRDAAFDTPRGDSEAGVPVLDAVIADSSGDATASACEPNPCQNGGTCAVVGAGYRCACSAGFQGDNCQARSCVGQTVRVGFLLPGWGQDHAHAELSWVSLQQRARDFGDCGLDVTTVPRGYALDDLRAYDAIILGDPAGAERVYSAPERATIRAYLTSGLGGAYATFLFKLSSFDNSDLVDLLGVAPATITNAITVVSRNASVVNRAHPTTQSLPETFTLLAATQGAEQGNTDGWSNADLLPTAQFVVHGVGESSVIINETSRWRSVYATGFPEYHAADDNTLRLMYNSILWAAGYR